ncbi:MAG: DUF4258 domain-containing protein [archaeon]
MQIIFTKHAEARIELRGILKQEVIDAIKYPDKTIKKHNRLYFEKKLGRGTIEVCCEKTEKHIKVITVYWM